MLTVNEYQPGALLFFLLPGLSSLAQSDFYVYEKIFFALNIFLLFGHFWLYKSQRPFLNVLSFVMIIAFAGPILLFRFELLVSLVTLLSFYFWERRRPNLALTLLGLAVSVKIYPLLFLPYFAILVFQEKALDLKKKLRSVFSQLMFFAFGVLLPFMMTFVLGLSESQMFKALVFHALKPVGIEGVPAMIVTCLQKIFTGVYPTYISGYGINGLPWDKVYLSRNFYNYFWLLPVFFFYYLIWCRRKQLIFNYQIPLLVILLFLISSKGLNPQYLFWFVFFFPLIKIDKDKESYFLDLVLILLSLFLTQVIYPLTYTQFLQDFYTAGVQVELFYLNSLRNFLLMVLFVHLFNQTFLKRHSQLK